MSADILQQLLCHEKVQKYIDTTDANATTPLRYAAACGQKSSANLLLEAWADPTLRDILNGGWFISYALIRGHCDFVLQISEFYRTRGAAEFAEMIIIHSLHFSPTQMLPT